MITFVTGDKLAADMSLHGVCAGCPAPLKDIAELLANIHLSDCQGSLPQGGRLLTQQSPRIETYVAC